ncbi:MAG TPA: hypothetical protein VGN72_08005 [Tepidisphaeraceae bacterium]|jgi:hypothetical protein|nr:hypothetical protein [Tepidisphaeraceae bacterium]
MSKFVVLVGHCNFDGPRLQREIETKVAPCKVLRVNDVPSLTEACENGVDLLLINREPVGFDEAGLDLVKDLHSRYPQQKIMLVSDYADAQQQAIGCGALPGFGKADMGSPKLIETVKGAIG